MVRISALAALAWALAVVLAPLVAGRVGSAVGVIYALGAIVCHQASERSFHLAGVQLPVCARCTGLYVGAAAGLLGWSLCAAAARPWPRGHAVALLVAAGVPTVVTVATAMVGWADPANPWRAMLALPLGTAGGLVVGAAVSDHLK
jgi:uncharacterized membrane protein